MRGKFWKGLVWGGIAGTILSAIFGPLVKAQRKPLVMRSADTLRTTTRDLMNEAKKARKKLFKR